MVYTLAPLRLQVQVLVRLLVRKIALTTTARRHAVPRAVAIGARSTVVASASPSPARVLWKALWRALTLWPPWPPPRTEPLTGLSATAGEKIGVRMATF